MKWKCKQSGTIIDLPDGEEKRMLKHPDYEKVEEKVEEKKPSTPKKTKE